MEKVDISVNMENKDIVLINVVFDVFKVVVVVNNTSKKVVNYTLLEEEIVVNKDKGVVDWVVIQDN